MAGVTGLEPATFGVTGRRSNQLSYTPIIYGCLLRNLNISYLLPFYNPLVDHKMVGGEGFEPPTLSV